MLLVSGSGARHRRGHATLGRISGGTEVLLLLILGLVMFLGMHLTRELGLRDGLMARFPSKGAYMGAYSVITLAGFVLIVWGKSSADFTMLWQPEFDQRWVSYFLMLPALILVVAGNFPMSVMRWNIRNPMMLGTVLWSVAHLWSNGDLASVVLFASIGIWAAIKFFSLWSVNKPTVPLSFNLILRDVLVVVIGCFLYAAVWAWHGELFGVGLGDMYGL